MANISDRNAPDDPIPLYKQTKTKERNLPAIVFGPSKNEQSTSQGSTLRGDRRKTRDFQKMSHKWNRFVTHLGGFTQIATLIGRPVVPVSGKRC